MAGSYSHVVDENGGLVDNETVNDMLENGGDVYEAVKEMYGMIWFLAYRLDGELPNQTPTSIRDLIEEAQRMYEDGIDLSPTRR